MKQMKSLVITAVIVSLLVTMSAVATEATTINIDPCDDAFVYNINDNTNYGSDNILQVHENRGSSNPIPIYYRTYLKFDLSDIPSEATINSAELQLYRHASYVCGVGAINLRPATGDWAEGTGGYNDNTNPLTGITWNNQPGYDTTITFTTNVDCTAGLHNWEGLKDLVQGWYDAPSTNNGMMLECDLDGIGSTSFFSNSKETTSNKPVLVIEYTEEGEIPEFSSIAIPVASILGLLFFFSYRKRRKKQ